MKEITKTEWDTMFREIHKVPCPIDYRKVKEQYLMTENKDAKPTGWSAHYNDGKWEITLPTKKPKKKAKKKTAKKATKKTTKKK